MPRKLSPLKPSLTKGERYSPPDRIEKHGVVIERLKFDDPKKH